MIIPFVGGLIFDNFDHRKFAVLLLSLVFLGELILIVGIERHLILLAVVGNLIFGVGSAISIVTRAIVGKYFISDHLTFALSVNEGGANIARWVASSTAVMVAEHVGPITTLFLSFAISSISLFAGIGYAKFSKRIHRVLSRYSLLPSLNSQRQLNEASQGKWTSCSLFAHLQLNFWVLAVSYAFVNGINYAMNLYMVGFLRAKFGLGDEAAALLRSLTYLLAVVACPLAGWAADLLDRPLLLAALAAAAQTAGLAALALTDWAPLPAVVALAFASGFVPVVYYAMVSRAVSKDHLGAAFGALEVCSASGKVAW
eukprot:CAMPEP_0206371434 /NCGR_PEP_ID=MMETSP0294-20121207/6477_1 /ASSEMBLY_ACC=CAM_ASM_000327 /TAXON_ID=39354 /ORGANISM="Heterosigma akashiwo, Strain CCMP2393" /LENGTH=313 /DNA_ID=CAMNT_0053818553 /DNA_START=259 /DNA_END=1197 /DNA_ORIENTATION=-